MSDKGVGKIMHGNTESTVAGTLLGSSGENIANLTIILPKPFRFT